MTEPRGDFEDRFADLYDRYLEDGLRGMDAVRLARIARTHGYGRRAWRDSTVLATAGALLLLTSVIGVLRLLPGIGEVATSMSPGASAAATGSATPSPVTEPTPHATADWPMAARRNAAVPSAIQLVSTGFWTLETSITETNWILRIGTLDGHVTREVQLTPGNGPLLLSRIPQPVGPAGGRVLYVSDDGHTATLHVVDATTGADSVRSRTGAIIPQLAIDPQGQSAFYLALDRATGAFDGVYEVSTVFGTPHALFDRNTIVEASNASLIAVAPFSPQLAVSDDGAWVAYAGCRPDHCDLTTVELTNHRVLRLDRDDRGLQAGERIVGIVGNLLIAQGSCDDPACDGVAIDVRTGVRWPLGGPEQPFHAKQLIDGPHGPIVLGDRDTGSKGRWHVRALDLTDRGQADVFSGTYDFGYTLVQLAENSQAELPPGWFLIYRNADGAPAPWPDYSAAQMGGSAETKLPVMSFPH